MAYLVVGMPLEDSAALPLSPTTAPPSPSGSRSKSSSVYIPQLRPIIWMAIGIFVPVDQCFPDGQQGAVLMQQSQKLVRVTEPAVCKAPA